MPSIPSQYTPPSKKQPAPKPQRLRTPSVSIKRSFDGSEADRIVDKLLLTRDVDDPQVQTYPHGLDSSVSFSPDTKNFLHARSSDFLLQPRQQYEYFALPTSYKGLTAGPAPGEVVGITLGATLGFLISFYLIFVVMANSAAAAAVGDEEVEVRRHHHHRSQGARTARTDRTRHKRRRTSVRSETSRGSSPLRTAPPPQPSPPRPPPQPRRIIVEETRTTRDRSRPPPPPSNISERITTVEQETRVSGDDMVEVMEEHSISDASPRPRRKSGYRPVDPLAYGGGDFPLRSVSRRRSPSANRR